MDLKRKVTPKEEKAKILNMRMRMKMKVHRMMMMMATTVIKKIVMRMMMIALNKSLIWTSAHLAKKIQVTIHHPKELIPCLG